MKLTWPPPYHIKYSPRSRTVRVQICSRYGLFLLVPKNFNLAETNQVLEHHKLWIEKTWRRLKPALLPYEPDKLPEELNLLAINEHWKISYEQQKKQIILIKNNLDSEIIYTGKHFHNKKFIVKILKQKLLLTAQNHLVLWLNQLSKSTGLNYSEIKIRNNSSLWGSCSAHKKISLNAKLLLLAPHLVEHVLIHELCHTVHLDHSVRFWSLFDKLNPGCRQKRKELKQLALNLPSWLEDKY